METLQDYITAVRILLQDTVDGAYRYSDDDMALAMTLAWSEAYRLRPDMFLMNRVLPSFVGKPKTTSAGVPPGYQAAFMYYIAGWVQLRDDEATEDNRASQFLNKFTSQLLTPAA